MDIISYLLGMEAGGGDTPTGTINITENGITNVSSYATADVNVQPDLESKSITITENTTTTITPTTGKDGLSSVEVITNVSGGDDWSDIGYSSKPEAIDDIHTYSKQLYDNWDAENPHTFQNYTRLVICPLVDTSNMTSFANMFKGCSSLVGVPALTATNNVTAMNSIFQNANNLEATDFSNFNTENVNTFAGFLSGCKVIKNVDLSTFNTRNVLNFSQMFYNCNSLETITFGNDFNLESGTNLQNMFYYCTKLDNNTLNTILHICTTATSYTGTKTLAFLGINNAFVNYANIPNLSNYQAFLNAGWTIS